MFVHNTYAVPPRFIQTGSRKMAHESVEDFGLSGFVGCMLAAVMGNTWNLDEASLAGLTRSPHSIEFFNADHRPDPRHHRRPGGPHPAPAFRSAPCRKSQSPVSRARKGWCHDGMPPLPGRSSASGGATRVGRLVRRMIFFHFFNCQWPDNDTMVALSGSGEPGRRLCLGEFHRGLSLFWGG
jgi:hypothetical protein